MRTRVLVIDNYDSFTYNVVQELGKLGAEPWVVRNDEIEVADVIAQNPEAIILSPGPGRPENAGITCAIIEATAGSIPLLGICLGHQAIGYAFGGRIVQAPTLMHGKVSTIRHNGKGIFAGVDEPFTATRYHSLTMDPGSLPEVLEVTATTEDGVIMGVQHVDLPIYGVQFHPESILSPKGPELLKNFLAVEEN